MRNLDKMEIEKGKIRHTLDWRAKKWISTKSETRAAFLISKFGKEARIREEYGI